MLAGDPAASEALLDTALARARTLLERVAVYRQRLRQDTSRGLGERAIDTGLRALQLLGVVPVIDEATLRARLAAIANALATRPIASLADLPECGNARVRAVMDVLDAMQPSTYNFAQPLYAFVTLELVELSLLHGNAPASVSGYGGMFLVLWQLRNDATSMRLADELGRVAVRLAERHGNDSQRSRAMIRLGACITAWVAPARDTLAILDDGFRIGSAAGELGGAGLNMQYRAVNAHFVGTNLEQLAGELERDLRFARKNGLELVAGMLRGVRRVVDVLVTGGAPRPTRSSPRCTAAGPRTPRSTTSSAPRPCWRSAIRRRRSRGSIARALGSATSARYSSTRPTRMSTRSHAFSSPRPTTRRSPPTRPTSRAGRPAVPTTSRTSTRSSRRSARACAAIGSPRSRPTRTRSRARRAPASITTKRSRASSPVGSGTRRAATTSPRATCGAR